MKGLIVAVALVVAVGVRLGLRARRRRARPDGRIRVPRRDRHVGETRLVATREIRERLRSRVFRVVTVVLLIVVTGAVVVPTLQTGRTGTERIGIVGGTPALTAVIQATAKAAGAEVTLVAEPDAATARAALSGGQLALVVAGTEELVVAAPIPTSDTSAGARFVRDLSLVLGAQRAYTQAGLTPAQAAVVEHAGPLPVRSLSPGKAPRTASEATALLGVIFIFIVLTQYLTWTLMGVMEEKASRVVEVLLATVRPIQLLAGKVGGIGAVALAQAALLVAVALALGAAVGSSLVHGTTPLVLAATFVWLVLGYAFYSWVYAAAGSLAERQDQVQSLALPLSAPLIFGYIVSLVGVSAGRPSTLVTVLAYLPPTAPFAMPVLVGFGEATWWQFALSAATCLACTVGVALVAARVYRSAVLRTGGRVRLRELVPTSAK